MTHSVLKWKSVASVSDLSSIIENTRQKPAIFFKHRPSSPESNQVKEQLEAEWTISSELLDTYLVDIMQDKEISDILTEAAGVPHEFPQIYLFADGVTMYDESHDMINVKKIKIALKIINRTFRWMETRV